MQSPFSDSELRLLQQYGRGLADSGKDFVSRWTTSESDTLQRRSIMTAAAKVEEEAYLTRKARLERMGNAKS